MFVFCSKITNQFGRERALELGSLPRFFSMTTHPLFLSPKASRVPGSVLDLDVTYTLPGDSILPSTDWERLLFGSSPQSLLALGDQPQVPPLSFLRSSPGVPPPPCLEQGSQAPLLSGNCASGSAQGCYVPGSIFP